MNAAKRLRQLLDLSEAPEQVAVLAELAVDLQLGRPFDLSRLNTVEPEYFELGLALVRDWRFDYHIAARSKLFEDILARDHGLQSRLCHLAGAAAH
ncbi:hypothetical protein [Chromobacterium alticapitis]|uniref:hypothetical protein n=1 Tax=Chromobacterium alticapitis TaxID=2073169 RepID=UPI0011B031E0|nr:hypothetical protein [Chromobacterium alticapitis]